MRITRRHIPDALPILNTQYCEDHKYIIRCQLQWQDCFGSPTIFLFRPKIPKETGKSHIH